MDLDAQLGDESAGGIAHAMHEHRKEDTSSRTIEQPGPEKRQGDQQTAIGKKLSEVKLPFQNGARDEIHRQMPKSVQHSENESAQ